MIVADPEATPVTSPADDTVATDEFDVVHVTDAPDMVLPPASFTVAVRVTVSPTEVKVFVLGEIVTVEAVWDTVAVAVALTEPEVAVIVAVPSATAVTRPDDDTVATDEFDVAHVTDAPDIVLPTASFTVAVSCCVAPIDERVKLVGDNAINAAVWATETEAVALTEPEVAVIVAVPSATAVTRPDDDTVATDEFDVVHVTGAPDIVFPPASFTVAVSCCVAPIDENERLVEDSSIEVAV